MEKKELMALLGTWFFWYKTWNTDDMLEEMYYQIIDNRAEDVLALATCFHKFNMSNDQFIEAIAYGKADTFLAFVPDHISECFTSEEEFCTEKDKLIKEVQALREITGPICYCYVVDNYGNQILS